MSKESVHVICECIEDKQDKNERHFSSGYIDLNTKEVLVAKTLKNEFIHLNYINGKKTSRLIESNVDRGWLDISESENGICYVPYTTDRIFYWNKKEQRMEEFSEFPKGYVVKKASFRKAVMYKNKIYLIPKRANMLIIVNERGSMHAPFGVDEEWDENSFYEESMRYSDIWEDSGKVYIFSSNRQQIIDITNAEMPFYMDIDLSAYDIKKMMKDVDCRYDKETVSCLGNIDFYIQHILMKKSKNVMDNGRKNATGKSIFNRCK